MFTNSHSTAAAFHQHPLSTPPFTHAQIPHPRWTRIGYALPAQTPTIARSLYSPPSPFVALTSPRRPTARSSIPIHPWSTQPRPATRAILFPINLGIRPGITIFAATIPQRGGLTDTGSGGGMVDTKDLKSFGHLAVRVQVPPGVRNSKTTAQGCLAVFNSCRYETFR